MKVKLSAAIALMCVFSIFGNAQAANLLINGSFEDTTGFVNQGDDTMNPSVGSTVMPGWTVGGSHYVSWIGPNNPFNLTASPGGGSYFLDLTGYIAGSPFSGVSQTITTSPGESYLLTFDLGSSPQWGLQDSLTATAGSASAVFTSTNSGAQTNLWQAQSLSFTATGSTTTISLIGTSGVNYIGVDNVSVVGVPVPEPAMWAMMLIGFGGIGAIMRTRRGHRPTAGFTAAI